MNQNERNREQKQQYLREKVLEQNYDAEEFMDFCDKEIGSMNIDQWSFEKLTNIVEKFIRIQQQTRQGNNIADFGQFDMEFGNIINDGFGGIDSPDKIGGETKKVDSSIADQFNSWDTFIQTEVVKKQEQKIELNLLDLDFLSSIGGNTNNQPNNQSNNKSHSSQKQSLQKNQAPNRTNQLMSVPEDIVKKLQEGNQGFIVGYNAPVLKKQEISKQIKVEEKKSSPIVSFEDNRIGKYHFFKEMECKKVSTKSRLHGNQSITVIGHQIINPNIFVPKYVLYTINTYPNNCEVKRRLKDFQNLRVLLKKFFPLSHIPHFQKCSRLSQTEPQNIKKQILFIQSFINTILMKKQLKCKLLEQFLLCKDLDLLKKIFKQYEKLSKPRAIEGLFTTNGTVSLKISQQNKKYLNQQQNLNEYCSEYFQRVKNLYDDLIENLEKGVKILADIEAYHVVLNGKIKNVNSNFTPQYQIPQLEKSLERIIYMHKQWGNSYKSQARIITSQIRHLFRYQRDNTQQLKQLIQVQKDISQSFWRRHGKEQSSGDYLSKRLEQFKTTIDSPSKNMIVLKHQYAYVLEKTCQQCFNYLTEFSSKLDQKYKLFCTLELSIGREMEDVWKNFQTFYK